MAIVDDFESFDNAVARWSASRDTDTEIVTLNVNLSGSSSTVTIDGTNLAGVTFGAGTAHIGSVAIEYATGGNISVATNATGATYNAFASQVCKNLTIVNDTATALEVQQGGSGVALPIPVGATFKFEGITNSNQLGVRRADQSATPVTVKARWTA